MTTPVLEVKNVTKHFGPVKALNGISLTLNAGECVALAGDNGAGKTTLIKVISGVHAATGGEVLLRGEPTAFKTPQNAREAGIETIYQDLALADNLTIGENIFLGREPKTKKWGFLPILDRKKMADAAVKTMKTLDFHTDRLDSAVAGFSGGQRQTVAIGRAVYWDASVLIMDEPTAALGVPEQKKVLELIQNLKSQGHSIIFISHNLQDIFEVSDRIVVMRRGRLAGERKIAETTHAEVVELMIAG
jgi:simple sugar transport system ATP-binding protein